MSSQLAKQLRESLVDTEVLVSVQRRGRDPRPGRPDSVLWLRPKALPVGFVAPILVELEGPGNYHASKLDAKCFAARHDPAERPDGDDFRYHLEFPTVDQSFTESLTGNEATADYTSQPAPVSMSVVYDLFTVPSTTVTGERSTTDARLHQSLRDRYMADYRARRSPSGFSSDASILYHGDTEIVEWHVDWRLPSAKSGRISVPFIVKAGRDVLDALQTVIEPIRLPTMAVIDGSPQARNDSRTYETGVRFPPIGRASLRTRRTERRANAE